MYFLDKKREKINNNAYDLVRRYPYMLELVENQTEELCLLAINSNPNALQYVKYQTEEMCLLAVKKSPKTLEYVQEQTPLICFEAVNQDGNALQYVKEQTDDLCFLSIKHKYSIALKYIKNQTNELALEAVKINGRNLEFVKNKTLNICLEAFKNKFAAIKYADKESLKYIVKKHNIYVFEYEKDNSTFAIGTVDGKYDYIDIFKSEEIDKELVNSIIEINGDIKNSPYNEIYTKFIKDTYMPF